MVQTLIGWYSTHASLCLSVHEPLCCSPPSDIFIFNWRVITFTRLHRAAALKTPEREKAAPPSAATSSLPPSLHQDRGGPHSACWPWWLEDPSHPLFCLFCNKMGCFSLLLQKNSPKTLHWGLWHFHVLTFGWWFIYICYSMLWTSKRMKEGLLC